MTEFENEDLVEALRRSAQELTDRRGIRDLEEVLARIVTAAVETVPGVTQGSVSMAEYGRVDTRHPTSEAIRRLDEAQSELNEGPCLSALADPPPRGIVVAQDFAGADAQRWPRFASRAVKAGYHGLLSTQISANGGPRAALNLYASEADVFDDHSRTLAGLFGMQAAMLLYGTDTAVHLQRAVNSRDLIGQAKGILMERFSLDDQRAFEMLLKSSQDTNIKITNVARWLTTEVGNRSGGSS
jgi:ANTAR domain-containing protein/GAF domain-containing protein